MKANGLMINIKAKENKVGEINNHFIRENGWMDANMGKDFYVFKIEAIIRAVSIATKYTATVYTPGLIQGLMLVVGNKTEWREKEFWSGKMGLCTKENSKMTKCMGLVD